MALHLRTHRPVLDAVPIDADAALAHWERLLASACNCVAAAKEEPIEARVVFRPYGRLTTAYRYQLVTRAFNVAADHGILARIATDDGTGLTVRLTRSDASATRACIQIAYVSGPNHRETSRKVQEL